MHGGVNLCLLPSTGVVLLLQPVLVSRGPPSAPSILLVPWWTLCVSTAVQTPIFQVGRQGLPQTRLQEALSLLEVITVAAYANTGSGRLEWLPCAPPDLSPTSEGCCLEPRMFVLWGMNNDADPISDAWVFDIKTLTWKEVCGQDVVTLCLLRIMWSTLCSIISANAPLLVTLQVSLPPWCGGGRVWHTASAFHPTVGEAEIVAFGGSMENLFKNSEVHIMNVQGTTVLRFGKSVLSHYDGIEFAVSVI